MPQVLNLFPHKMAFRGFQFQTNFTQALQHEAYMLEVLFKSGRKDEDVVYVGRDETRTTVRIQSHQN